jgi:hypothetical protein
MTNLTEHEHLMISVLWRSSPLYVKSTALAWQVWGDSPPADTLQSVSQLIFRSRKKGLKIQHIQSRGYRLLSVPHDLAEQLALENDTPELACPICGHILAN